MARRFVRIDLSTGARDFLPVAVEPGVPLLDDAGTNRKLLFRWLRELAADPEPDGESVNFHVLDAEGGRLEEVACEPATEQDLSGPLRSDLELLRERIKAVKPETTTERALLKILKETFESQVADLDGLERSLHFFKYCDALDRWRLVWCWGFRRRDHVPGQTSVCGHAACNLLFVRREGERTECPGCEAVFQAASAKRRTSWKWGLLVGLLLLAVAAVLMYRSPDRNPNEISTLAPPLAVDEAPMQGLPPDTKPPVVDEMPVNAMPPETDRPVEVSIVDPDDPVNESPAPDDPASNDPVPGDPMADGSVSDNPAPDDPIPSDPMADGLVPDNPVPDNPAPDDPAPNDPVPSDPMADGLVSDNPVPDNPAPNDPAPDDPIPNDPMVDGSVPGNAVPDNPATDRPETNDADKVTISISPAEVSLRVDESSPPFTVVVRGEQGDETPVAATLDSLDPKILAPVASLPGRFVARLLGQTQVRAVYRGQEVFAEVTVTGDRFRKVSTSLTSGEDDFSVTLEVLAAKSEGPLEYRVFESGSAPPEVWVPSRTYKEIQRVELASDPIPYRSRRARYTLIIEARASGEGSVEQYPLTFRLEPRIILER